MIHAYLKIGEKQDIVFPQFILERNKNYPDSFSFVISARYLVQPYLIGFLVTRNREIKGEPTEKSRPSSTHKFSRYKQAGVVAFIPAKLLVEGPKRYKEFVLERIRCTLLECENVEDMPFEYLK